MAICYPTDRDDSGRREGPAVRAERPARTADRRRAHGRDYAQEEEPPVLRAAAGPQHPARAARAGRARLRAEPEPSARSARPGVRLARGPRPPVARLRRAELLDVSPAALGRRGD